MPSAVSALFFTVALLWAGIDWRWAWLVVPPLGVALALRQWWAAVCFVSPSEKLSAWQRTRRWAQTRGAPGGLMALLVLSFHLQALGGLGLQYDSRDVEVVWLATLGICIYVLGMIVLLQVLLACCVTAFRILRMNQPWPALAITPRAALVGGSRWLAVCAAWVGIVWLALMCGTSRHSLHLVDELGRQGIQVFSQARYAQEQFRVNYLLAGIKGTPKPAWHELIRPKSISEALAQSKHPGDRWSYVVQTAVDQTEGLPFNSASDIFDHGLASFSYRHAHAQGRPELARLIVRVDPGSPADKAGVKRGDQVLRYDGTALRSQAAIISQTVSHTATKTITVAAPAIYRNNAVGHVSFLLGDTLLEDVPAAELEAQALSGSQRFTGLYVALHGFELSLDAEFKRKLGDAYGLALGYASAPFFMQGIETVVLDLRSNNGGYRNTIFPFAFALMGDQFAKSAFIHEKSLSEFTPDVSKPQTNPTRWYVDKIDKRDPLFRLKPKHLIVLTSPYTCSAGELLIYGMREMLVPSAKITVIGEPTCGKPFGFPYQTYFGYQHAVINSATVDAQGQPAYSKGLQPDCTVRDDFKSDVLSSQDQLWQAARHYIKTGQCPSQNLAK